MHFADTMNSTIRNHTVMILFLGLACFVADQAHASSNQNAHVHPIFGVPGIRNLIAQYTQGARVFSFVGVFTDQKNSRWNNEYKISKFNTADTGKAISCSVKSGDPQQAVTLLFVPNTIRKQLVGYRVLAYRDPTTFIIKAGAVQIKCLEYSQCGTQQLKDLLGRF